MAHITDYDPNKPTTYRFTPKYRDEQGNWGRLDMLLDDEDIRRIGSGRGWRAVITNTAGEKFIAMSASCGIKGCHCDSIVKRVKK